MVICGDMVIFGGPLPIGTGPRPWTTNGGADRGEFVEETAMTKRSTTTRRWTGALATMLALVAVSCSDDSTSSTDTIAATSTVPPSTDAIVAPTNGTTGSTASSGALPASASRTGTSTGCRFLTGGIRPQAFCDSFDAPIPGGVGRSGDLDATVWGVSRTNTLVNDGQGEYNVWLPSHLTGCGADVVVTPPRDVQVCDGRLVESAADGTGQSTIAIYPKQPFVVPAGETGTVSFDVGNDSAGVHSAWPEFWWTDQPVPAPHGHMASQAPFARNSFGFSMAQSCDGGGVGIDKMLVTREYVQFELPFTVVGCVAKGSPTKLNHIEVRINQSRIQVWASEPGGSTVKLLASADSPGLTFTKGLIWIEDVHYNACKLDGICDHSFVWDNVGFDGPTPYRDLAFDAADANVTLPDGRVQLGYNVTSKPLSITVPDVYRLQPPTDALVAFNWFPIEATVPRFRLNGGEWHDTPWPFDPETYTWRTIAVSVPLDEIHDGDNLIEFVSPTDVVVSNIDLILVAGSPVPT